MTVYIDLYPIGARSESGQTPVFLMTADTESELQEVLDTVLSDREFAPASMAIPIGLDRDDALRVLKSGACLGVNTEWKPLIDVSIPELQRMRDAGQVEELTAP